MECPTCHGKRRYPVFVDYVDGTGATEFRVCETCAGIGTVDAEVAARVEAGQRLRRDRLARRVSLDAEARSLGISVLELSARELGREWKR